MAVVQRELTERDIWGLVRLLADEDVATSRLARNRLKRLGPRAFPFLAAAAQRPEPVLRGRARLLLDEMRFSDLCARMAAWASQPDDEASLEDGAFLVARFGYPDLDEGPYRAFLNRLAQEAGQRLAGYAEMDNILDLFGHYLFVEAGFRPGEPFDDPDNCYLNRVLERRRGLPIALSVVYVLVRRRLGLPVSGVGLPGRFVVRFDGREETVWIDPWDGGRVLSRSDCAELVRAHGYPFEPSQLLPCSPRAIVARMLLNLIQAYGQAGDQVRVRRLTRLAELAMGRVATPGA